MNTYVCDRDGRYWRRDIFHSFVYRKRPSGDRDVMARYYAPEFAGELTATFSECEWESDKFTSVLAAHPGCSVVDTFLDDGEFCHQLVPILAVKLMPGGSIKPITNNEVDSDSEVYPILHPTGQVVGDERVWASLDDYLQQREATLRKRAAA